MVTENIPLNILFTSIIGFLVAGSGKILIAYLKKQHVHFTLMFSTGGMPSSHSATVASLTTGIYMYEGFTSLFVMSLIITCVVMFDAFGVRYQTGKQAKIINRLMSKEEIKAKRFNESVGHTPKEVFAGAIVGIIVAILFFYATF